MKTRLAIFIAALLLLPLAGLYLSGENLSHLANHTAIKGDFSIPATLHSSITLLIYTLLVNHIIKRITGNGPLDSQRRYYIAVSIASALLGWLLSYLNIFVASWTVQHNNSALVQLLVYSPAFALLAPAVLLTRALLATFPGLLRSLAFSFTLPEISRETGVRLLLPIALLGLLGGAAWPKELYFLLWSAPLLLLITMQLMWHESTIFSGLKSGDFGRIVCTALSSILVCNIAAISYQANAYLQLNLPNMWMVQAGFILFGLLCLQLGDVIAENWRGKPKLREFPIPVVTKND